MFKGTEVSRLCSENTLLCNSRAGWVAEVVLESGPGSTLAKVFLSTVLSLGFVFKAVVELLLQGCFYREMTSWY